VPGAREGGPTWAAGEAPGVTLVELRCALGTRTLSVWAEAPSSGRRVPRREVGVVARRGRERGGLPGRVHHGARRAARAPAWVQPLGPRRHTPGKAAPWGFWYHRPERWQRALVPGGGVALGGNCGVHSLEPVITRWNPLEPVGTRWKPLEPVGSRRRAVPGPSGLKPGGVGRFPHPQNCTRPPPGRVPPRRSGSPAPGAPPSKGPRRRRGGSENRKHQT